MLFRSIERLKPFHTLTGRQQFYVDHDWMLAMGEGLPTYRPPLNMTRLFGESPIGEQTELGVSVRYLTPHNKWSIHSEYQDNLFMLSLSRGGQSVWMSDRDAAKVGIKDNDWIECFNANGALTARVGIAAMEVCRPLPFIQARRPSVGNLVGRGLKGLFGND